MNKKLISAISVIALSSISLPSSAINLVKNGDFMTNNAGGVAKPGTIGYGINSTSAKYWSTLFSMIFNDDVATNPGVKVGQPGEGYGDPDGSGMYTLYGPGEKPGYGTHNNGLTASPTGPNYLAEDGAFNNSFVSQTITGLTPGKDYYLTFDYALAQEWGGRGAANGWWTVSLGSQSQKTDTLTIPNGGFSGWKTASMTFTATAASEVLKFASHANQGEPPTTLLAGVVLEDTVVPPIPPTDVPEPINVAGVAAAGLALLGSTYARSQKKKVSK